MTSPDLHQLIHNLITAATQAGQDTEQGHGLTSNIPVEEAKRRLYTRLEQHGLDGTGWTPEPVSREKFAELERERLNGIITDLQDRLADMVWQRDQALARVDDLEEELAALGQLGRAEALIQGCAS